MVVLKCRFGLDTRRIRLDTLNYQQLTSEILPKMFSEEISKYHITYTDPDLDTVFMTNSDELKEALLLFPDILVINLLPKNIPLTVKSKLDSTECANSNDSPPSKRKLTKEKKKNLNFLDHQ